MDIQSRRAFLKRSAATAAGLTLGPRFWAFASEATGAPSPFGALQDDLLLRLPEGFSYKVVAETGLPLLGGRPYVRPDFPDLNVVFPQTDGSVILSTSHEVPREFPLLTPAPGEDYDRVAGGSVSSLHLAPDLSVLGGAYNAGGMLTNCSGSGTPWGTVLTGEESQATMEKEHGFVWEVDIESHTKLRCDGMGKFDHETAVVHRGGAVYLTEDSNPGLLYRFTLAGGKKPGAVGDLAGPGTLEAFGQNPDGSGFWVSVADPLTDPAAQGIAAGARSFSRLEGGSFDPFDPDVFYFAETENPSGCGRVWRINVATNVLEEWASPGSGGTVDMCMPDNLAFDPAGNVFLAEDKGNAGRSNPNRILFVNRSTGDVHVFGELVQYWQTPENPGNIADEPTGPAFWLRSDGSAVMFLNLQRAAPTAGLTLAIEGPFAVSKQSAKRAARLK